MYIPSLSSSHDDTNKLARRQGLPTDRPPTQQDSQTWTYVVVTIIAGAVFMVMIVFVYIYLRRLKVADRSPKYIPTKFLKRKWEAWKPKTKYANLNRRNGSEPDAGAVGLTTTNVQTTETAGVNRNTSIRSIMTLPAYSQKPQDTEQVIAREGERAGIDTVVELPETVDEEEERREAEMESLYQIRQARRREIAERDERRRERREARERGDFNRLEELRRESRTRREQNSLTNLAQASASNVNITAETLIAEHNSRGRDRRVSSVSYAALGQVRHDGTRIRSNSNESEQSGLLGGAAPMGLHNRNGSDATLLSIGGLPQPRYRDRSNSAATSISTVASSFENVSPPSEYVRPTTARTDNSSHITTGSISEISADEADIGSERLVISGTDSDDSPRPPDYEGHEWGDAPAYTEEERVARMNSTATTRSMQAGVNRAPSNVSRTETLSIITPSIHIETPTGPNTPVVRETILEEQIPDPVTRNQT